MGSKREVKVGLIGYGFMGRAHSHALTDAPLFFDLPVTPIKAVVCGRTREGVEAMARRWGWHEWDTSWERVVGRDDIDLVSIVTPTVNHSDIAIAAASAGKMVICEKPFALNVDQARNMVAAVERAGTLNMVMFNYRRVPALRLARDMIQSGELGSIYHFRAVYLQDWIADPNFPMTWHLRREEAGSGVHADLNSHLVDLARFLVGEIESVIGMATTFVKERAKPGSTDSGEREPVTVDDAMAFLARFENGAAGTFEATRFAYGRKNHQRIEINGSKGSLVFNLERLNELQFYSVEDDAKERGFRTILVTENAHPYISAWWPPGHMLGYEHTFVNAYADFMKCIGRGEQVTPSFRDGFACQQVIDAVLESVRRRTWIKVKDV